MKHRTHRIAALLLAFLLLLGLAACGGKPAADTPGSQLTESSPAEESPSPAPDETEPPAPEPTDAPDETAAPEAELDPDGSYTTREDVSLYLYTYGKLPGNFITKQEARDLGWSGGSLEPYAPGKCIGGDRFGNYEGLLPEDRTYHECDINTLGADSRGAERLVFSTDGLIYYTGDHYETFTLLYGEE